MTTPWQIAVARHPALRVGWVICLVLGVLRVPLPVLHEHAAVAGLDPRLSAHVAHCHPEPPLSEWLDCHWHWLCWEEWCAAEGLEPGIPWSASPEFDLQIASTVSADVLAPLGPLPHQRSELWSRVVPDEPSRARLLDGWGQVVGGSHDRPGRADPTPRTGLARC